MRLVLEFEHQILVDTISLLRQGDTEQNSINNFVTTMSFTTSSIKGNSKVPLSTELCYVRTQIIPNTASIKQKQPYLDKVKISTNRT